MIYSLGANCACAEYLRKHYLRKKSGPFDWIASADVYAPFKTLVDEFRTFLDFSFLRPQPLTEALNVPVLHAQNGYLFLHDFFKIDPLEKQQPAVLEKYQRRIGRLLEDLKSNRHILFCWYGEKAEQLCQETVLDYIGQIRKKYPAPIDFLFVIYDKKQIKPVVADIAPGVTWHALPWAHTTQRKEGCLLWDIQAVGPIFKTLHVTHYKKTPLRVARGVFYRILAAFIWNRTKRHMFLEGKLKDN